ncbi:hypothetical protein RB195_005388 [Necator americanus]|uniref:Histone H2A n=1 Tax=Necator americanus TaxID=51031 RepID=A0ABR1BR06_NECAM
MPAANPKRSSIMDHHRAEVKPKRIARTVAVPLITVYQSIRPLKTTGGTIVTTLEVLVQLFKEETSERSENTFKGTPSGQEKDG